MEARENGKQEHDGGGTSGEGPSDEADAPVIPSVLPVLPLRDSVVFNSMIVPLFEGREKALDTVEFALNGNRYLLLCTQHDASVEEPLPEELYTVGSVVMILRMIRMNDGQVKLLVQGLTRARVEEFDNDGPILLARVSLLEEKGGEVSEVELEAMLRSAREQSDRILHLRGLPSGEIMNVLNSVQDPGRMADIIAANMRLSVEEAQGILECLDPVERLRRVNAHLLHEVEIATMQARIQGMAREGMDKAQREYFLREQLKAIHKELGDSGEDDDENENLRKALDKAGLPPDARREADKQLRRLSSMHGDSAEATVVRTYLDLLAELPWKKMSRDRLDIVKAAAILDEDHYGLEKVKDRILEFLSVRKLNPDSKGPVLCFVGPPGVGKTSLGRSIARALGRRFQRISLGGVRDEAEIRGHRRTYIGAMPGRIIQAIRQAGTRNPVIVLDEIDKLGNDFRGDPSSALLEALDPEQNSHFSDHYLNLEFDLSKVLFLCTANQLDTIPPALLDRLEIIHLSGYTEQEKLAIARRYLIRRQRAESGLKEGDVTFRDNALTRIIRSYTREAGLRTLERQIGAVCRKLARRKAEGENPPFVVTPALVGKLLGAPRFLDEEKEAELLPGVALGLAWTQAGGEVLHVEVSTMQGKGALLLTGQLGDVMKESAQAAVTYARSHAKELDIDPEFSQKLDIHIHVPAGATPKDGPSAGVTLVSALVSALTGRPVRGDTCMTGEITLRGRVLPVGGIKEKILGAVARGLKRVVIPTQNTKDLEEIPAELRRRVEIHTVDTIAELLALVLEEKKSAA
ncbi:MAG TPA: endopeptidase La [Mailhella massiliensis]|uniref:Lon protease n=1 Tax=Mailhella massiliensis TaxID=1903261 RepID=A0A921DRV0_9BACT|nr:endopeptidase La [Mailhella massiliensis]HJD97458.1 endopeptidase La [Mailhella massiliensis]